MDQTGTANPSHRVLLKTMAAGREIRVRGLVQGVGFRPTVWVLAERYGLTGRVLNDGEGVLIHAWGKPSQIDAFIDALKTDSPPLARIDSIEQQSVNSPVPEAFLIMKSQHTSNSTAVVPDAASCSLCIGEINDPANRRYRYPFTNCTHCGPRLSIIDAIPYDRANTSMADFMMCPDCMAEYQDPGDRRFHAQPNACPACGPEVWLHPDMGEMTEGDPIQQASQLLRQGAIIAIKGLGGFHLAVDATNPDAVGRLRSRKFRAAKPFALMASSLEMIRGFCHLNEAEAQLLQSSAAPILLLKRRAKASGESLIADAVAPGVSVLGFMLPYTPLHQLLLESLDFPLVMTSGNRSHIPQCIDNQDALSQLEDIADYWLLHNRDIRNRVDDSVARVINNRTHILRRARGYAPSPLLLPKGFDSSVQLLAMGAELKNSFCLLKDGQAMLSQHMGDLENTHTYLDYKHNLKLYRQLFEHQPDGLVIDAHPDYLSSKLGVEMAAVEALPLFKVQHHHAHIASCLAENDWPLTGGKVLGIALDGLGYGDDNSLWGAEFLLADYADYQRLGSLKPVRLLGGNKAMTQPWRNTLSQLVSAMEWQQLAADYPSLELITFLKTRPLQTLFSMHEKGLNSPLASSCGRLFDAVAAALNLCREEIMYEGQAAMELEALVTEHLLSQHKQNGYPFPVISADGEGVSYLDPAPMWRALLEDLQHGIAAEIIATAFHLGLATGIVHMVEHLARAQPDQTGSRFDTIVLSGGVFQNATLFQLVTTRLEALGYRVLSHTRVPANDGGIALGQAVIAAARMQAMDPQ